MTLVNASVVSRTAAGATPIPITPTASDTIGAAFAGPNGWTMRLITTGTTTTYTPTDPNITTLGSPGTPAGVVMPATGVREIVIPLSAINLNTQLATLNFTGALTGVTYELYRA